MNQIKEKTNNDNLEIELKYLINKLPNIELFNYDLLKIEQYYFEPNDNERIELNKEFNTDHDFHTFRVRKIESNGLTKYILTMKTKSFNKLSRFEFEKEITEERAKSLILNSTNIIIKNRYRIKKGIYLFEFDEYLNLNKKLFTVEVEIENEEEIDSIKQEIEQIISSVFKLDYEDITNNNKYKNSNLNKYFGKNK